MSVQQAGQAHGNRHKLTESSPGEQTCPALIEAGVEGDQWQGMEGGRIASVSWEMVQAFTEAMAEVTGLAVLTGHRGESDKKN